MKSYPYGVAALTAVLSLSPLAPAYATQPPGAVEPAAEPETMALPFQAAAAAAAGQDNVADDRASEPVQRTPVPWAVGERLSYNVHFGPIKAGSASMEVRGFETVRGREAYHTVFEVKGGIPFYRVHDVFESWMDTRTLASLRFVQDQDEGPKERERRYEIFPETQQYRELVAGDGELQQSVAEPLDDGSFLYFIRTVPLVVGMSYEFNRYFRPDRNPVTIRVLRRESVKVPAGTFDAIVIQPIIKTSGIFSDKGRAEIWLSDDDRRIMLQMKSKLSFGSLNLYLTSHQPAAADSSGEG